MQRLILFLLTLATFAQVNAIAEPIKLGVVTDLTGVGAYWGMQAQRGLALAEGEIKRDGGDFEIIISDHAFKPLNALSESQRLIEIKKVDAVWVDFAPTVVASSGIIAKARKLFLANSAATSVLKGNPYAFKAYLDYERGCAAIAKYWRSKGLRKVAMLKVNAEFADLCLLGAKREFPEIMLASYDFSESVKSQILSFKSHGIEAIFNTALEADMLNTLKVLRELNYRIPVGVTEPEGLTEQVKSLYGDMLEGVTSFGFPAISTEFRSKFSATYPDASATALEGAAMAYTHARQIYSAIKRCPTREISCIVAQMSDSTPDNTLQFLRWENRVAVYDFTVKEWHGGKLDELKLVM